MNREGWARMEAHWNAWMENTLATLQVQAATGDEKAQRILHRWHVLQGYPYKMKGRPALNRAMRENR